MRAVFVEVDPQVIEQRRRTGLDRWDEMWEGVLHMAPAPALEHQRILDRLIVFLKPLLEGRGRGTVVSGINVFNEASPVEDYRIPDLTFVAAGHESLLSPDGIRGGGPDAVIEVRSPGDESFEKLPFFASLGVQEVIVLDRDGRKPEIFRLAGRQCVAVAADREGWIPSETLRIRFRRVTTGAGAVLEDMDDPAQRAEI